MRKWYVFDKYNCFGAFTSAADAATQAEWMANTVKLTGVHIHHFTVEEFNRYLKKPVDTALFDS
jgi:hypothetical protein